MIGLRRSRNRFAVVIDGEGLEAVRGANDNRLATGGGGRTSGAERDEDLDGQREQPEPKRNALP